MRMKKLSAWVCAYLIIRQKSTWKGRNFCMTCGIFCLALCEPKNLACRCASYDKFIFINIGMAISIWQHQRRCRIPSGRSVLRIVSISKSVSWSIPFKSETTPCLWTTMACWILMVWWRIARYILGVQLGGKLTWIWRCGVLLLISAAL